MAIRPPNPFEDFDPQPVPGAPVQFMPPGGSVAPAPPPPGPTAPTAPTAPPPTAPTPFNYTGFRDAWMGSGVNTVQGAQDWLKNNAATYGAGGVSMVGDKFDLNGDGVGDVDVVMGAKSGGGMAGPQWTNPYGAGGGAGAGAPGAAGAGGAGGPGSGPLSGTAFGDALRQQILKMLGQDPSAVSINDPMLSNQAAAFRTAQQRALDMRRAASAERRAASGQQGGAVEADTQSAIQDFGESTANFEAQLVGRELQNRRDQLMQALNAGIGMFSADEQRALQRELAAIDAELRGRGLAEQGRQFDLGLGQRQNEWNDQNDLSWANFFGGRL